MLTIFDEYNGAVPPLNDITHSNVQENDYKNSKNVNNLYTTVLLYSLAFSTVGGTQSVSMKSSPKFSSGFENPFENAN